MKTVYNRILIMATVFAAVWCYPLIVNAQFDGPRHKVAHFDGVDDYIELANPFQNVAKGVSIETWIEPDGDRYGSVFTLNGTNPTRRDKEVKFEDAMLGLAILEATTLRIVIRPSPSHEGGLDLRYEKAISDKHWNHVELTLYPARPGEEKGSLHLIVNSYPVRPTTINGRPAPEGGDIAIDYPARLADPGLRLEIGRNSKNSGRYFKGMMDDLRISYFDSDVFGTPSVPSAVYNFDDVEDSAGRMLLADRLNPKNNPVATLHGVSAQLLSDLRISLMGYYLREQPRTPSGEVQIKRDRHGALLWKNHDDESWSLDIRNGKEVWTGKDCPHGGEQKLKIVTNESGAIKGIQFGSESFERLEPPSETAPKLPTQFIVETYGVHGRGNADQPKYFIGVSENQLKILQATLEEGIRNENGVQTITREKLDGGLVALKIGDRYLPDFAATIGDANKYREVAPVFPPKAGEKDFISLELGNSPDVYLRHSSYRVFNGAMRAIDQPEVFLQDVTWHFHEVPSNSVNMVTAGDSDTKKGTGGIEEHIITNDLEDQNGAVWSAQKINFKENFKISAEIYLGSKGDGADGLALVFQAKDNQLVSTGSGIGYQGISPSIAIEFDTYQNKDENNDPVEDHVGLRINGDPVHTGSDYVEVEDLEDGKYHPITFEWNAGQQTFSLTLDGKQIFKDTKIPENGLAGQQAYVGFTAATGLYSNLHKVRSISSN